MDGLKARPGSKPLPSDDLGPSLLEVGRLHGRADSVHAVTIATFLAGLQSFISLVGRRRLAVGATRLEAVTARIGSVLDLTNEWIQSGREEREAILKVLPG